MKIMFRQGAATEAKPGCVWLVGDDGETRETAYLAEGQELAIETTPGSENYLFGPVIGPGDGEPEAASEAQGEPGGVEETLSAPEGGAEAPAGEEQPQSD